MKGEPSALTSTWFYENEGQQKGPLATSEIRALIEAGSISQDALVWKAGWKDWTPLEGTELREALPSSTVGQEAANAQDEPWYYEWDGKRVGPVSTLKMQALIASKTLDYGSMVWQAGMTAWAKVEDTELAGRLKQAGPPPLTSETVNPSVVWLLAVSPFVSLVIQYAIAMHIADGNELKAGKSLAAGGFWYIPPLLSIALSYWDVAVLKKAGVNVRLLGQAWLVPVYLFKRAKLLHQNPAYFWVWLVLFVLSLLAP